MPGIGGASWCSLSEASDPDFWMVMHYGGSSSDEEKDESDVNAVPKFRMRSMAMFRQQFRLQMR